jgi:hypothetical protein
MNVQIVENQMSLHHKWNTQGLDATFEKHLK